MMRKVSWLGQTLVETVIALAVVIILVSSLVSVAVTSVRSASLSRNKTVASNFAYQELERVRAARDVTYKTDWDTTPASFYKKFASSGGICFTACHLEDLGGGVWDFVAGNAAPVVTGGTSFAVGLAGVQVDPAGDRARVKVIATVSWTDSLGSHSEKITTVYTKWQ